MWRCAFPMAMAAFAFSNVVGASTVPPAKDITAVNKTLGAAPKTDSRATAARKVQKTAPAAAEKTALVDAVKKAATVSVQHAASVTSSSKGHEAPCGPKESGKKSELTKIDMPEVNLLQIDNSAVGDCEDVADKAANATVAQPTAAKMPAAEKKAMPTGETQKVPVAPHAAVATSTPEHEADMDKKELSKDKIEALEKLLAPLEKNMAEMKEEHVKSVKADQSMAANLRGTNNTAGLEQTQKWNGVFTHMYEKDRAFGHTVTGMLKHAIHYLKKGDDKGLQDLIKNMGQITR